MRGDDPFTTGLDVVHLIGAANSGDKNIEGLLGYLNSGESYTGKTTPSVSGMSFII